MEDKICFYCEEYKNPFGIYSDGTKDNPENFSTIQWIGTDKWDYAHQECIWKEKQ